MELITLTALEALLPYRDDWNRILEAEGNNNPFIEFDYVYHWLTHFLVPGELWCYAVFQDGEAVAFIPLLRKRTRFFDLIRFCGFGQANYMDVIARKAWRAETVNRLLDELGALNRTVILLHGLLQSAGTAELLTSGCERRGMLVRESQTVAPWINLAMPPDDFDGYVRRKMKRHGADRKEKRLRQLAEVTFSTLDQQQKKAMFRLHERRWQAKMDTSGFTKGRTQQFYSSLSEKENGVLSVRLDGLYVAGKLIAFYYGLVCRDRYVLYVLAHDDDFGVFSPGRLLLKEVASDRYDAGFGIFDLSIGYESYKLDWNTDMDQVSRLVIAGKGLRSRLAAGLLSFRDQLVALLKSSPRLVHFKRNTLGKLKQSGRALNKAAMKRLLSAAGRFLYQRRVTEIYRADRTAFQSVLSLGSYKPLSLRTLFTYPGLAKGDLAARIARLYHKQKGYYLPGNPSCTHAFWVSSGELRLEQGGFRETLPPHTAFVYDWELLNMDAVAGLFKNDKQLDAIYIAFPNPYEGKNPGFLFVQGFVPDHQISSTTICGFHFVRKRHFQPKEE